MFRTLNTYSLSVFCAAFVGVAIGSDHAHAADAERATYSQIGENLTIAMETLPGFASAVAYLLGVLLGVLGILKIKDHVESPTQVPLKEGAIRLLTGGALFGLPLIMEAMHNSIGTSGVAVGPAVLYKVRHEVR